MALNYSIDVAVASDASTTTQGNIFEAFCRRFLKAEGYSVTSQVYTVAGEADLYATNDKTGERILAECKSQKSTIRTGDIAKLCGKRDIDDCSSGWLITASALGKGAKGIKLQWKGWPEEKQNRLRFFDPEDFIPRLVELGLICDSSVFRIPNGFRSAEEARLVITALGEFWAVPVLDQFTGLRNAYVLYDAHSGLIIQSKDVHHLIRETRSQLTGGAQNLSTLPPPKLLGNSLTMELSPNRRWQESWGCPAHPSTEH